MTKREQYIESYTAQAHQQGLPDELVGASIQYRDKIAEIGCAVIYDQVHFAELVGYEYYYILAIASNPNKNYKEYTIPKKRGGVRVLEEPYPDLKDIQSWILNNILMPAAKTMVSPVAKAFMPGKSIRDNARFHKNKKIIVALDVENFFGSIQFGCVYEIFREIGYSNAVATLLTKLCTYNNVLPQGAPTSPMLSNLVMKRIDDQVWTYCKDRKIIYTRYADDMTFSGDSIHVGHLISYVAQALNHRYLHLNTRKTKVMGRGTRQSVTGVVVNEKVQVSKAYRDKIRQEVYYCIKYGFESHMSRSADKPQWISSVDQYIRHLLGKVEFVLQINPNDRKFMQYAQWLKSYHLQLY